jgi:hypothetical protein
MQGIITLSNVCIDYTILQLLVHRQHSRLVPPGPDVLESRSQ